jgi:hypothetical protein
MSSADCCAQKATLDADTKVALFRQRKASQARQKALLAALVRVRDTVDKVWRCRGVALLRRPHTAALP